jgi:hypothetical protein
MAVHPTDDIRETVGKVKIGSTFEIQRVIITVTTKMMRINWPGNLLREGVCICPEIKSLPIFPWMLIQMITVMHQSIGVSITKGFLSRKFREFQWIITRTTITMKAMGLWEVD